MPADNATTCARSFAGLRSLLIAAAAFGVALLADVVCGASPDERFLDGLRQRQLFALAEKYCRDGLARNELSAERRAELTIELSRTLAERALQDPPERRDDAWRAALSIVEQFAKDHPQDARLVQVRAQQGLVELSWGDLLRQEAEQTSNRQPGLDEARKHLRAAIELLERSADKAAEWQRRRSPARKPEPGELSSVELRSLERNLQYQLARALRSQGESYAEESADRMNSLTQAAELLRPLSEGDVRDPLTWPSRLDSAMCYRLLGHLEAATRRLDQLDTQSPPAWVAQRARAERIHLALADDQISQAATLAEQARAASGQASAEVDYAVLKAFLAAWSQSVDRGEPAVARGWQDKAAAVVRDMQRVHGAYWQRRAEGLFAERIAASPTTTDVEVLARAAEGFYRGGNIDDALAAYDRAVQQAHTAGQEARAFDLGFAAAAIEHERKNYEQSADRFRQVAVAAPKLPKASEAHLMAIYDLGQLARAGSGEPTDRYRALLEEHLKNWPAASTAARAHLWLGRLFDRDHDLQRAADQFRAAAMASDTQAEAVDALVRCCEALLAEQQAAGKPTAASATAAVAALQAATGLAVGDQEPLSIVQWHALLATARILLTFTDDGFAKAEDILQQGMKRADSTADESAAAARALLVYAIAAQGRIDDAAREVDRLVAADPAALERLVNDLQRASRTAPAAQRKLLAALELRILDLLDRPPQEGSEESRRERTLARGRALLAAGRKEDALTLLKELADAHPRDGAVQEALALALFEAKDSGALVAWQNVERRSRSGSERWLRAKLHEALIYERTGDRTRAAQTVNTAKTLYPELGGGEQKQQFLALLKRCQ